MAPLFAPGQLIPNSHGQCPTASREERKGRTGEARHHKAPHPPYPPDLSLYDYHATSSLEAYTRGEKFHNRQVRSAVDEWISSRPSPFSKNGVADQPNGL